MKTIPKSNFLGINNRLPINALTIRTKESSGTYLRDAVNVDVDDAKQLRSRKATERIQALTAPHSLYTTGDGTHYLVRDSVLYRVTLPTYAETLVAILASNDRMSYVEYDGSLYFSNGTDGGRITAGVVYPLGLPTPNAPTLTSAAGTMPLGKYQVCVSYVNSVTGEEGGVSAASTFSLASEAGLRVTLPAATPGATHVNVYVSDVNGSVLRRASSVVVGTVYLDVAAKPTGREANRRYEVPLPAGTLFLMNGMLCSFKGSDIFEGVPYRPGYYVPLNHREAEGGRVRMAGPVSNVVPTQGGAYVVADKTYWFAGPRLTTAEVVREILPYGGVPGTAFESDDEKTVGWFGVRGVVIGTPAGEIRPVMAEAIDQTPPVAGVSAYFEDGGYHRVVSCGWCVNTGIGAATRYTGYDFTSISGNYATAADGIYRLDVDGPVDWLIDFGREDFGAEQEKRLPAVYASVDCEDPVTLRVTTPAGDDYSYDARSAGGGLNIHRIDPGKGLRSNWYGLELSGLSELKTLASVSFAPAASQRRI